MEPGGNHLPFLTLTPRIHRTLEQGSTDGMKSVTDYLPPSPGVGCHRYIFVLFKGAIPNQKNDERICWDVSKFMNSNPNLVPVAMNFMYVTSV